MNVDLFEEVEPMILAIAAEFGRRHHIHGADAADFAQELRLWLFENEAQVAEWLDPEVYEPKHGLKMLAASLRNECSDYGIDIKAQATGYERGDIYFYNKGEVKSLLEAVFDPEKWHEPPQSEGRSTKSAAEGGGWIATLADISRGVDALKTYDRNLLLGFHKDGWNNKMMAEAEGISESVMSFRHDRAVSRLVKVLGDLAPRPMRAQETRDPWRGRRAIPAPAMQAYERKVYDGE